MPKVPEGGRRQGLPAGKLLGEKRWSGAQVWLIGICVYRQLLVTIDYGNLCLSVCICG